MAAKALITGGSGLLGSWVLRHWDIPELTPTAVGRHEADLLRPGSARELLAAAAPNVVVHLAWCASGQHDYRTSPDNERWLDTTLELARACTAMGTRLWLTGTAVDEDVSGEDAYTRSKVALRHDLRAEINASSIGWLRPFYVFDEERGRPGLVKHALRARSESRSAELQSAGRQHDFIHASDVGRAVVSAVGSGVMGVIPIGSGKLRRVSDLVEALGSAWHQSDSSSSVKSSQFDDAADISRLHAIGWKPLRTEEFFGNA